MKSVFLLSFLLMGCAGPTTPFGGLEFWSGDGQFFTASQDQVSENVSLTPNRQVLHMTSPLKVEYTATDTSTKETKIYVTYNQKDVTQAFERYAQQENGSNQHVKYIYPKLRLAPNRRHQIDIYVKSKEKILSHVSYLPPECSLGTPRSIASIDPFKPERNYLGTINYLARENQLNPAFLAGLIAQESGFDSEMVSRSKAVGLTQVTPVADEELKKLRPEWNRDARIESLRPHEVEDLIRHRKLSGQQDWRLDPVLAIEGGALYLNYLRDYWSSAENKLLLKSQPKVRETEVILASYNSGASRVKNKIQKHGANWLDDEDLKEAFKYVSNVESYCYHFSSEAK